jgi:hypothetical protein
MFTMPSNNKHNKHNKATPARPASVTRRGFSWLLQPRTFTRASDMQFGVYSLIPLKTLINELVVAIKIILQNGTDAKNQLKMTEDDIEALAQDLPAANAGDNNTYEFSTFSRYCQSNKLSFSTIKKTHGSNACAGYFYLIISLIVMSYAVGLLTSVYSTPWDNGFIEKFLAVIMLTSGFSLLMNSLKRFYHAKLIERKLLPEQNPFTQFIKRPLKIFPHVGLSESYREWYMNVK